MKKFILGISVFLLGNIAFSQENGGTQKVERMKVYKVERNTNQQQEPAAQKTMTTEEEIEYCQGVIEALEKKEAYLKSNPEENKIALEEGWYEKAEATKAEMRARIAELKK